MTPDEIDAKLREQEEVARAAIENGIESVFAFDRETEIIADIIAKEIPEKPTERTGWPEPGRDTADGYCPRCGLDLICSTPRFYSQYKYYCRDCGQAIDWRP